MSGAALARLLVGGAAVTILPALFLDADLATARVDAQARERVLYVSAFDENQQPVRNLGADAFVVREDGTRREVLKVGPATTPQSVAIIIDNSAAVAPAIADRLGASRELAARSLAAYGETPLVDVASLSFTEDQVLAGWFPGEPAPV